VTSHKNLTDPFSFAVAFIVHGTVALLVLTMGFGVLKLLNHDVTASLYGFGDADICVPGMNAGLPTGGSSNIPREFLKGVASAHTTDMNVCATHPTLRQRLLVTFTLLPLHLVYAWLFLGLYRLTRIARREGVFAIGVGRRLRILGKVITFSAIPAVLISEASRLTFIDTLRSGKLPISGNPAWIQAIFNLFFEFPLGLLLVGLALITIGKIFLHGSSLTESVSSSDAEAQTPTQDATA
jgi:hypothetical protein